MNGRRVVDVSTLAPAAFGHRSILWWGTMGIILIEGMAFALALFVSWASGLSDGPFPNRRTSAFEIRGVPFGNALPGLPCVVFLALLVARVARRRWVAVAALLLGSVVLSVFGAAVLLFNDWRAGTLEPSRASRTSARRSSPASCTRRSWRA